MFKLERQNLQKCNSFSGICRSRELNNAAERFHIAFLYNAIHIQMVNEISPIDARTMDCKKKKRIFIFNSFYQQRKISYSVLQLVFILVYCSKIYKCTQLIFCDFLFN